MSATTQCSSCKTRFKVSQEQLDAHQGLVRCGRCQSVFNATEYLQDNQDSSQLDLPLASETPQSSAGAVEIPVEVAPKPSPTPLNVDLQIETSPRAEHENLEPQDVEPVKKKRNGLWLAGCLLLVVILFAQTAYFFRIELAANQPGLKPLLLSYCQLLRCSVPLPQKADLMSIESSDLEANPAQPSIITLNVQLSNHATYTQTFPNLELTLTDSQDRPLAIRTFRPVDYLRKDNDERQGIAANHELSVKLNLDTGDLKPAGYRLLLFYPQ